jgi:rod shape-determining protein MreD
MRTWLLVITLITVTLLQVSFLAAWRPLGVVPNLVLVTFIWLSFSLSVQTLLITAAGTGLALDLLSGTDFGLRLVFMLTVVLAILVIRQLGADVESLSLGLAMVVAATIFYNLAILAGLAASGAHLPGWAIAGIITREIILNLILALLMRPLLSRWLQPRQHAMIIRRG